MTIQLTLDKWACTDCLLASQDSSYPHPRRIDHADIAYLNWDYCSDHTSEECRNCGGDVSTDTQDHFDNNDGFDIHSFASCDICDHGVNGGSLYRYQD